MAAQGASEVGHAYVTIMPSMDKFNKEVREGIQESFKNLSLDKAVDGLAKSAKNAGKAVADTVKKETSKGAKEAGKEAGNDLANAITSTVNSVLSTRTKADVKQQIKSIMNAAFKDPRIFAVSAMRGAKIDLGSDFKKLLDGGAVQALREIEGVSKDIEESLKYVFKTMDFDSSKLDLGDNLQKSLRGLNVADFATLKRTYEEFQSAIPKVVEETKTELKKITDSAEEVGKQAGEGLASNLTKSITSVLNTRTKSELKKQADDMAKILNTAFDNPQIFSVAALRGAKLDLGEDFEKSLKSAFDFEDMDLGENFKQSLKDMTENDFRIIKDVYEEFKDSIPKMAEDTKSEFEKITKGMFDSQTAARLKKRAADAIKYATDNPELRKRAEKLGVDFTEGFNEGQLEQLEKLNSEFQKELADKATEASRKASEEAGTEFGKTFAKNLASVQSSQMNKEMKTYITAYVASPEIRERVKEAGIEINDEFIKGMKQSDYSKFTSIIDGYAEELKASSTKAAEEAAAQAGTKFGQTFNKVMKNIEESNLRQEMKQYLIYIFDNDDVYQRVEAAGYKLKEAFTKHMTPDDFSGIKRIVDDYRSEMAEQAEQVARNTVERFVMAFRAEVVRHENGKFMKSVKDLVSKLDNPEVQQRAKSAGIKVGKDLAYASADQIEVLKKIVDDVGQEAKLRAMAAASEAAYRASDTFKNRLQEAFQDKAFLEGSFKDLQAEFGGINFAELKPASFDSIKTMGRKFTSTFKESITNGGEGVGSALSGALTSALSNSPISLSGLSKVKEWWDKIYQYASQVIEQIQDKLKDIGLTIGRTMLEKVGEAYMTVGNTIKDIGTRAASAFYEAMKNGYTKVVDMVRELSTRAATMMYEAIRDAYSKVAEVIKDVGETQITNAAKNLGIDIGGGIDQGLSTVDMAFGEALGNIINNVVGTLNSDLNGAIERFDTMENFPRIMANMGVEADQSTSNINRLADAIDGLPTALNDITTFTEKVFPMFDKNLGEATTFAIAFNNALVADGKTASQQANAMEQMSQMLGNSKVDMLSWRSVVEAMPTSMNQLAEYFGAGSPQELYNMLPGSKGAQEAGEAKVSLEELTQAFVKLNEEGLNGYTAYAERAKTATFGIGTAVKNLHNRVERAIQAVMEFVGQEKIAGFINNLTKKFVPSVTQAVGLIDRLGVKDKIAQVTDTLNNGLDQFMQKLGPITEKLEPFLGGALNVATQLLNSTIGHIIDRAEPFINLVADKMGQFIENAEQITNLIQPVIDSFIDLKFTTFESAINMWQQVIEAVAPVLPSILGSFARITSTVATFIGNISGVIAPTASNIFSAIADGIEGIAPRVESIITSLAPVVETMVNQIISVATTIVTVVDDVLKLTNSDGVPYITNIINDIGAAATSIMDSLSPFIGDLLATVSNISDVVLPIIANLVNTLAPVAMRMIGIIENGITTLAPTIERIVTALAPIVVDMVGQVFAVADKVATVIADVLELTNEEGEPLMLTMIETIGRTIITVIDAISPYIPTIVNAVDKIVEALSPLITSLTETLSPIVSAIVDRLAEFIVNMSPFIERIITALAPVVQIMVEQLASIAEIVGEALAYVLEMTDDNGVPLIQHIIETIGTTIMDIIALLAPHLPTIMQAIAKIVDALAPAIEEIFDIMEPYIDDLVNLFVYAAQQFAPAIVEIFRDYIAPYMPEITAVIRDLIDFAVTHLKSMVTQAIIIVLKFEPLITDVKRIKDDWMPAILRVAGEVANVFDPFVKAFEKLSEFLKNAPKIDFSGIFTPAQAFATGGIVTQPTRAIIGEAGVPEAVVPLSAAGIEKFTSGLDKRYKNGGAPSVNVNIGTFVNNDTSTDVNSLCDQIGRTSLRKLREQGVAA